MLLGRSLRLLRPSPEIRELALLREIGKNPAVSQRALARSAGLSATMVNAYIDSLVGRGLVEVTGETNRTYRYSLTPAGRARLMELSEAASREAVEVYRMTRDEYARRLEACRACGIRRVVILGATEAGELAALASERAGVEVLGVVDPDPSRRGARLAGRLVEDPAAAIAYRPDAVLVACREGGAAGAACVESLGLRVLCL